MGEARMRLMKEGEALEFNFTVPEMHIIKGDQVALSRTEDGKDETLVLPRAVRTTISATVQAAFPQGMDRRDGRIWAAWLEVMDDEAGDQVKVTRGQVDWIRKHLANEDVKVNPSLAQWREAVLDYVLALLARDAEQPPAS